MLEVVNVEYKEVVLWV